MPERLFTLDEIGTTRSYDYTEAILISPHRFTARTPMSTASFKEAFLAHFPVLKGFDWANVAVRGGAVVDILLGRPPVDLDVFLFGLPTPQDFVRRAGEVLNFLLQAERASVEARNAAQRAVAEEHAKRHGGRIEDYMGHVQPASISIKGLRRGCVATVWSASLKVPLQIVLTTYGSLEAVVAGADMDVCGATFDGERVLVNGAGRWSLENLAIRVQDGCFPKAARLQKYFMKGFDVVLPGLDVKKLPTKYLRLGLQEAFETPCLTVTYSAVAKNKVTVASFLNVDQPPPSDDAVAVPAGVGGEEELPAGESLNGYDDSGGGGGGGRMAWPGTPDGRTVLYQNMERLVAASVQPQGGEGEEKAPPDFSVFAEADFVGGLLAPWPELTPRQVENTMEGVRQAIAPAGSGTLNFGTYRQFVKTTPLKALLGGLAAGPEADGNLHSACVRAVAEAVELQKAACNAVLPKLQAFFEGKLPPVLTPEETYKYQLVTKRELFYGEFLKDELVVAAGGGRVAAVGGA